MVQDGDQTGLQHAASQCWSLICSELIDRGADVTAADRVMFHAIVSRSFHDPSTY